MDMIRLTCCFRFLPAIHPRRDTFPNPGADPSKAGAAEWVRDLLRCGLAGAMKNSSLLTGAMRLERNRVKTL
jgi:hypothetical protein